MLIVAGKLLGTVSKIRREVAADPSQEDESVHLLDRATALEESVELAASTDPYPTGEHPLTVCSLTLVAGRQLGMTRISPENTRERFQNGKSLLEAHTMVIKNKESPFGDESYPYITHEAEAYFRYHKHIACGKLFFLRRSIHGSRTPWYR